MSEKFSEDWVDQKIRCNKTTKEPRRWMLKNSSGKKSASLTLLVIVTSIVLLRFLLGGIVLEIGSFKLGLKEVNLIALSAFISPFIALYGGRRFTDMKFKEKADSD